MKTPELLWIVVQPNVSGGWTSKPRALAGSRSQVEQGFAGGVRQVWRQSLIIPIAPGQLLHHIIDPRVGHDPVDNFGQHGFPSSHFPLRQKWYHNWRLRERKPLFW